MSIISTFFHEHVRSRDVPGLLFVAILVVFAVIAFSGVPELPRQIDDLPALQDAERMNESPGIFYSGFHHRTGRPTGHIVRYVIYLFSGMNSKGFHLFSIALHITIAFLVSHLAFKWHAAMPRLAGILFLLNIAHFKAVHHIAALEYLLATAFSISAYLLLWEKEKLLTQSWRIGDMVKCCV